MKYYGIKPRRTSGYLSETLCRIDDNNNFEIYDYYTGKPSGVWVPSEKYKKRFEEKDYLYEIRELNDEDVNVLKMEADNEAYDDYHTSYKVTSDGHTEYIYQDYKSVNGVNKDN